MQFENLPMELYYTLFSGVCSVISISEPKLSIFGYMKHYEKIFDEPNRRGLKPIMLFGSYIYFNCVDLKQLHEKVNIKIFYGKSLKPFINPMVTYESSHINKDFNKCLYHFNAMIFTSQITEFRECMKFIDVNKFTTKVIDFKDDFNVLYQLIMPIDYVKKKVVSLNEKEDDVFIELDNFLTIPEDEIICEPDINNNNNNNDKKNHIVNVLPINLNNSINVDLTIDKNTSINDGVLINISTLINEVAPIDISDSINHLVPISNSEIDIINKGRQDFAIKPLLSTLFKRDTKRPRSTKLIRGVLKNNSLD